MKNYIWQVFTKLASIIIAAAIISYSISVHFFNLFAQSKMTKVGILLGFLPFISLTIYVIFRFLLLPFYREASRYLLVITSLITVTLSSLFIINRYEIAPFFTTHTLKIQTPSVMEDGKSIEIRDIYYSVSGPSATIPTSELIFSGNWEIDGTTYLTSDANATLTFQKEMLGGITIVFRSNTSTDKAEIIWDQENNLLDTFEFVNTETEIVLPANSWGSPNFRWSIIATMLLLTDILSIFLIAGLVTVLFLKSLQWVKNIHLLTLFISLLLLFLNITGMIIPMRNPELSNQIWDFAHVKSIIDHPSPTREERFEELVLAIHNGIANHWENNEDIYKYNLRVPIYENYILFSQRVNLTPEYHRKYEFISVEKALERGVGICSQKSIILFNILQADKIPAKIIGLPGHIMVTAELENGNWWMLDPDYGVIIRHDLAEIIQNPEIICDEYRHCGYSEDAIDILVEIYGRGKITPYNNIQAYFDPVYVENEKWAYILIWLIPIFFTLPTIYSRFEKYLLKKD